MYAGPAVLCKFIVESTFEKVCGTSSCTIADKHARQPDMNLELSAKNCESITYTAHTMKPHRCSDCLGFRV